MSDVKMSLKTPCRYSLPDGTVRRLRKTTFTFNSLPAQPRRKAAINSCRYRSFLLCGMILSYLRTFICHGAAVLSAQLHLPELTLQHSENITVIIVDFHAWLQGWCRLFLQRSGWRSSLTSSTIEHSRAVLWSTKCSTQSCPNRNSIKHSSVCLSLQTLLFQTLREALQLSRQRTTTAALSYTPS